MTIFYICRHGETENNKNQRLSGWIDTPLTEQGERDAIAAAQKLQNVHFDKVISSDLGRAFETAYIISRQLGVTFEIERSKSLREVNYGDFSNQPYSAYPPGMSSKENADFIPPNGESLAQMQQRVLTYVEVLGAANSDQTILLVAHDGTINAIRASFTGENMGVADETRNPHDYVAKFELKGDQIVTFREVG